ncbi:unnamed protein product [Prorocentrum cordatum]|uniref:Uncharacterized protein n=1 Tax=Prorocentrum cordatum TaxID=2364126 RepID=A0ABN9QSW6_9DINO|nr:unnamed protein product [Polarella glacialis]
MLGRSVRAPPIFSDPYSSDEELCLFRMSAVVSTWPSLNPLLQHPFSHGAARCGLGARRRGTVGIAVQFMASCFFSLGHPFSASSMVHAGPGVVMVNAGRMQCVAGCGM